jgi:hypothetical protein
MATATILNFLNPQKLPHFMKRFLSALFLGDALLKLDETL